MLPPTTHIGSVHLTVTDLEAQRSFYERALGLRTLERDGQTARLGPEGGPAILELSGHPDAPRRPRGSTGLFHFAVLVPDRAALAQALRRVLEAGWRFSGASDHLVSEALYLDDPEGNGIEIYRDRPREEWRRDDEGVLQMATLPLDLDGVLGELDPSQPLPADMPGGTRIGHMHLQVASLREAEEFYSGTLGFDVMVRSYPGALFVSAGGYHHHIGLNTWQTAGGSPPPHGAAGLRSFEVVLPSQEEADGLAERARGAGAEVSAGDGGAIVLDPWRDAVLLTGPQPANGRSGSSAGA
jgi:catechol 2,3-dioxygenase